MGRKGYLGSKRAKRGSHIAKDEPPFENPLVFKDRTTHARGERDKKRPGQNWTITYEGPVRL